MTLAELRVSNVRCIQSAALEFEPELNLVTGANGAGKTSILEAIFLLGRGRSFRTRNTERLIRHGHTSLTVFGRTSGSSPAVAGVEVSGEGTRAKINGSVADSLMTLSAVLPVQAIDPDIHKLIDQGPERRRRWLDWLVFHVEPTFAAHWSRYQRALRQRNAALKTPGADFKAWDVPLLEHGQALAEAREAALSRLRAYLDGLFAGFSGLDISIGMYTGWSHDQTFAEALRQSGSRDRERGTTTVGPHRADITLRTRAKSARETLSRGQQKLTAVAMMLAPMKLLQAELGITAVLLLDDPAAELDAKNLQLLFEELSALNCQMIATSLSPEVTFFQAPKAVFHVEQGRVVRL